MHGLRSLKTQPTMFNNKIVAKMDIDIIDIMS